MTETGSAISRLELGVIATIILAIIGGALWLGELHGRLKALESTGLIEKAKDDAIKSIRLEATRVAQHLAIDSAIPVGAVVALTGPLDPAQLKSLSWLPCNGQEVSHSEFPELCRVLRQVWGKGDAVNTCVVPGLNALFLRGVSPNFPLGMGGGSDTNSHVHDAQGITGKVDNILKEGIPSGHIGTFGHSHSIQLTTEKPSDENNIPRFASVYFVIKAR